MINSELKLFFTALTFYSRLPAPAAAHKDNTHLLPDAVRYLPVIGWIAGIVAAMIYMAANYLFGTSVALLLSMVATVLLTGAFHEDGFADVCDGFGGGWTKEKILLIMKDSRVGAYGAVGIILLLGIKFAALQQLFSTVFQVRDPLIITGLFIVAHALSRFAAVVVMFCYNYARTEESKVKGAVRKGRPINLIIAGISVLLPLGGIVFYTSKPLIALIIVPVLLLSFYLGNYFKKWIGGYTGDCLGAVQQLTEVVIYLSYILLWKFT
jgi:adenosylcobinamide-GDP ribazoletransferase